MHPRLETFIVSTLHGGDDSSNAFIVPITVEAYSREDAAQKRFDMLHAREKENTLALLVKNEAYGMPHFFAIHDGRVTSDYKIKGR